MITAFNSIVIFDTLLRVLLPVILSAQLYIVVSSIRLGMERKYRVKYSAELLIGFALFFIEYHLDFSQERGDNRIYQYHDWMHEHLGIGANWLILIIELVLVILFIIGLNEIRSFSDSHINRFSIKEAMDKLPNGVAFADEARNIVFYNLRMKDIMPMIGDRRITDIRDAEILKAGEKFLQFRSGKIIVNSNPFTQITAWDITDEYLLNQELESKNTQLRDIQERLRAYSEEIDQVVISEEILNARKEIHDSAGHVLLTARYYLENPDKMDPQVLMQMMKQSNEYLLREAEEEASSGDPWQTAMELAESIGVRVITDGEADIADEPEDRLIIAQAVSECSINLVKHANGDELYLRVNDVQDGEGIKIEITNNGDIPTGPIKEAGGLKYVRRMVEDAGGEMNVFSDPEFRLEIILE